MTLWKAKPSSISNQIHLKIAFVHPSLEEETQDTQVKRGSRPKWRQFFLSFFPSLPPRLESLKLCWKLNGINHEQGNQGRFISAEKRCQILNASRCSSSKFYYSSGEKKRISKMETPQGDWRADVHLGYHHWFWYHFHFRTCGTRCKWVCSGNGNDGLKFGSFP